VSGSVVYIMYGPSRRTGAGQDNSDANVIQPPLFRIQNDLVGYRFVVTAPIFVGWPILKRRVTISLVLS
jgi:hypothetical protein